MVISHIHRYVFVELPRTGSTAISHELRENYDGELILNKHSTYDDFLRIATPEEKKYFVFSCIRNPMDDVVSVYSQYKTNHHNRYTDSVKRARNRGIGGFLDNKMFDYVQATDLDFQTYFLHFYWLPYDRWASLSHKRFDFIIRFEDLVNDFDQCLRCIGLAPKRLLPAANTTARERDYRSYYTDETIGRAKFIFGPYMKEWGYTFPHEWGNTSAATTAQIIYTLMKQVRTLYWRHLQSYFWPSRISRTNRALASSPD